MANAALSNADRKKLRKAAPAKPRVVAGEHVVRVAAEPAPKVEPAERDGFIFLSRKRLSPAQVKAGLYFRDLFRFVALYTGADVKDSIERLMTSGGGSGGLILNGASFSASAARAELFRLRWVVSGGQVDVLTVLDGVCGIGHTLIFLAGGKRQREEQLMQSLRIGLDLVAADMQRRATKKPD